MQEAEVERLNDVKCTTKRGDMNYCSQIITPFEVICNSKIMIYEMCINYKIRNKNEVSSFEKEKKVN